MSGLLADTRLSPEQHTYVSAIHDSGTALLALIEDILDTTLIEADRLELRQQETEPRRLIEDICELLAARAHQKEYRNIIIYRRKRPKIDHYRCRPPKTNFDKPCWQCNQIYR